MGERPMAKQACPFLYFSLPARLRQAKDDVGAFETSFG